MVLWKDTDRPPSPLAAHWISKELVQVRLRVRDVNEKTHIGVSASLCTCV